MTDAETSLDDVLERTSPVRPLAVGPMVAEAARRYAQRTAACRPTFVEPAQALQALPQGESYDLALVEGGGTQPDAAAAPLLLARLRDVQARVTVVLVPEGTS